MDTDQVLQDLEERVLDVVEEAMDFAYHEGIRDALDAVEVVKAEADEEEFDSTLCSCGCGLTNEEISEELLRAAALADNACDCGYDHEHEEDGIVILSTDEFTELTERLGAVEEYVGLKFTG